MTSERAVLAGRLLSDNGGGGRLKTCGKQSCSMSNTLNGLRVPVGYNYRAMSGYSVLISMEINNKYSIDPTWGK